MDEVDVAILRAIVADPLARSPDLGEAVGLAPSTVRRRLRDLEGAGPVRGFRGVPHADLLGRIPRVRLVDLGDPAPDPVEATVARPGVVWASLDQRGRLSVMAFEDGEADGSPGLENALGGDLVVEAEMGSREDAGPGPLGPLDWRVLRALVASPRRPVSGLAGEAGVSPGTARERRRDLLATGALRVVPVLEAARSEGVVLHVLTVRAEDEDALEAADAALDRAAPVARGREPGAGPIRTFLGHAPTMADAAEARDQVQDLEGVRAAHVSLNVRREFAVGRLEGWADEALARWDEARSGR
jgi:DNA-binding Lrp family transcriptional regulator